MPRSVRAAMVALVVFSSLMVAAQIRQRHFRFTYAFTVRNLPLGKPVRVWFPMAASDKWQTVKVISARGDLLLRTTREPEYGDRMFYATARKATRTEYHFAVTYDVVRRERVGYRDGHFAGPAVYPPSAVLRRFLEPDRLVPTTGKLAELAKVEVKGDTTPMAKARSIYDYVFRTMRYDKSGTGWGRGDAEWACDAKHGNCTDFHSLFISMARSQGIPSRFAIGFPIPENTHAGEIPGYHCWVDFYADHHWVPIDISEAWLDKAKKEYYFGSHGDNRVQFSVGRDIRLSPKQSGPPVNYFVYPYVEAAGKEFLNVRNEFRFADVMEPGKTKIAKK